MAEIHNKYMLRAIQLAQMGLGATAPNPLVGAVLVHNDHIIGEGYHRQYGHPHAEVNAIESVATEAQRLLPQSTLYVTLEPCSHHGKTPPCADLIIKNKIPKVVIGSVDINPKVSGAGIQKLRKANIEVITPIEERKCMELNKRFFTYFQKKRPYIILKWAQSGDGYMALPGPRPVPISSATTDRVVHRWRSEEQAILVGSNTARIDNPQLNNRLWAGNSPVRIVLDRSNTIPDDLQLLNGEQRTLVYTRDISRQKGATQWIGIDSKKDFIVEVLADLHHRKITSVLIEGGAQILHHFIAHDLWDECRVIEGKLQLGDGLKAPETPATYPYHIDYIGKDRISYFRHSQMSF